VSNPQQRNSDYIRNHLQKQYVAWKGVPYKEGGNSKRGVDCSGFVHLTFKNALGVNLPRSTKLLLKTGTPISRQQLSVGDLVFFKTGGSKRHVGIYIGKGQFIHASTSKGVIRSNLKSPYWSKHYWKSKRVLQI
jgi:cell wall-associated NlpC family hydrolase